MKKKENYLDYIPVANPDFEWDVDKDGIVTVHVKNKGIYNKIAQKVFRRPEVSHIKLDKYGSFAWQQMAFDRTVYDISKLVKEHFGDEAEPIVERLVKFFQICYQHKFIGYVK